jgi:hypothetical protein
MALQQAAVDLVDEDVARRDLPFVEEEIDPSWWRFSARRRTASASARA